METVKELAFHKYDHDGYLFCLFIHLTLHDMHVPLQDNIVIVSTCFPSTYLPICDIYIYMCHVYSGSLQYL